MLRTKDQFKTELRDTLDSHLSLDHPIFAVLMTGEPKRKLLNYLTLQGFQLTKHFLTYVEHLFFYCPLPKHKKRLLYNLYEEETGRISRTKNHVDLMKDFIRALGISDEERDAAQPLPETKELIDYRLENVKDPKCYHIGAAAVMIASEGQSLEEKAGEARHTILGRKYGIEEKDSLFFSVHQKEDVGHVREGIELSADFCTTEEMQAQALQAVDHTCKLFHNMYEGIYRAYKENRI